MDNIICNIQNQDDLQKVSSLPEEAGAKELAKLGFTSLILSELAEKDLSFDIQSEDLLEISDDIGSLVAPAAISSESLWRELMSPERITNPTHTKSSSSIMEQVGLMMQMSLPRVPICDIDDRMIPGTMAYSNRSGREFRELLRSLTFWRTRFNIGRQKPRLVHADEHGLLIYIIDSWLVALNFTSDDASIDVGTGGAMWLMLGTGHDVHLHGNLLDLPRGSGAILANELAR